MTLETELEKISTILKKQHDLLEDLSEENKDIDHLSAIKFLNKAKNDTYEAISHIEMCLLILNNKRK